MTRTRALPIAAERHASNRPSLAEAGPLLVAAALVLAGACEPDRAPAGPSEPVPEDAGPTPMPCIDRDGDGFGHHCEAGYDCDDLDPERATSCGATPERCEPGQSEACWRMLGASADALSCGTGTRTCSESGLWGECQVEETFDKPLASRAVAPIEPCNPCAPGCGRATDDPGPGDLTTDNSENVEYNVALGGITLDDNTNDPTSPVFDTDGDGVPDNFDAFPFDPTRDGFTEVGELFALLPFGGPVVAGETDIDVQLRSADIYFLMDTTGSMQGEIDRLRATLTQGNFITNPALCGLPPSAGTIRLRDWNATYWDNTSFTNPPAFTRVDPEIAFADFPDAPEPVLAPSFDSQNFTVRWEKVVDVPADSTLNVEMRTDDGMRVRVDGAIVWDAGWRFQSPTRYVARVPIAAGPARRIAIEYFQATGGGTAEADATLMPQAPAGYEGVIGALSCQLADPTFGVGYFDDYPIARYGYSLGDGACNDTVRGANHDLPFFQLAGATPPSGRDAIVAAVDRLSARCGDDVPESHIPALYAYATGSGLPDTREGFYVEPPSVLVEGADPFRAPESLVPVGAPGAGPATRIDYDAGDVTATPRAFEGDTSILTEGHSDGRCSGDSGAPDATFRFEVTADGTEVLLSTQGSSFDTTLHLYEADGDYVACDDDSPDGTHSVIRRVLASGTYLAVVDGKQIGEAGPFRLYVGPVQGDDALQPLDLGDLSNRFVQLHGDTDPADDQFSDFTGAYGCWGGNKDNGAEDVVFRFRVTRPTNFVATNAGTSMNTVLQLRGGAFERLYCHNGAGNQASLFQRLDPGTYHVVISSSGGGSGRYRLGLGTWPDDTAYITQPAADCSDGPGGYPCVRRGAVPIVVMFTDAEMHNDAGGDERYDHGAPAYMDAITALNRLGAKVVGIHSGDAASVSCSTPCRVWNTEEVCRDETVCTARTYWTECWDETYCAERGDEVTTCSMRTFCQQGGICWDEEVCTSSRPCIRVDTRERCRDRSACTTYETTTVCRDRNTTCREWGETTCSTSYRDSERSLRRLATDTNTVDTDGEPLVYQINPDGSGLSEAVVEAIAELAGSYRMDVSLRPNDDPSTPDVDERDFVKSIATVSTGDPPPETLTRCLATEADFYRKCLPGTQARFVLGLQNDFVPPATDDRLFQFEVDVLGDGVYQLGTVVVNVVVPAEGVVFVPEGSYWRDYDSQELCGLDQAPRWTTFDWDILEPVPTGASITFEFQTAPTQAGLDAADVVSRVVPGTSPPIDLDELFEDAMIQRNYRWLRARAVLRAPSGRLSSPVLYGMETRFECLDVD